MASLGPASLGRARHFTAGLARLGLSWPVVARLSRRGQPNRGASRPVKAYTAGSARQGGASPVLARIDTTRHGRLGWTRYGSAGRGSASFVKDRRHGRPGATRRGVALRGATFHGRLREARLDRTRRDADRLGPKARQASLDEARLDKAGRGSASFVKARKHGRQGVSRCDVA